MGLEVRKKHIIPGLSLFKGTRQQCEWDSMQEDIVCNL